MATMPCVEVDDLVVRGDGAKALHAIREPEAALALWARELPEALADTIGRIGLGTVDDLALTIDLPIPASALAASLVAGGYEGDAARLLAADILALARQHAVISGTSRLAIRLEVVETDACRRFHADYVRYRLLTTYRGAATQWIRADTPDCIEQMRTGEVAVFKGRLLLPEPPILHRSPPLEESGGEPRLLLVIDPADAA